MTRTYGNISGSTTDDYPETPNAVIDLDGISNVYIFNTDEANELTFLASFKLTPTSDPLILEDAIGAQSSGPFETSWTIGYQLSISVKSSTPGASATFKIESCVMAVGGGSGSGATAQEVWEYATRSLTDKLDFLLASAYDRAKTAASATELSTSETAIKAEIAKIPILGDGSKTKVYTVYDSDGSTPLEGVRVTVYTDISMANECVPPVQGTTDILGRVTFQLDPGTYYLKRYKLGKVFANPDTEVVEA